ncbi:hypothetical protein A0H81_07857 [Grifola frondosa]|uniref:F-box domain-containing protein n=1 Tax=Grifola frondosa TaxID=5627 RepID=A0A1C7M6Z6_GRIFR|nr:hypothetical protein A0H81_07857 [Grifola frondosa]
MWLHLKFDPYAQSQSSSASYGGNSSQYRPPHPRDYVQQHKTELEAWDPTTWKQAQNTFEALKDAWAARKREIEDRVRAMGGAGLFGGGGYGGGAYGGQAQEFARLESLAKEAESNFNSIAASAFQMNEVFTGYRQSGDIASKRRFNKLTDLAQDILLEIAQNLSVQDVLMLKQTCHCLNTFGSDGYLWRQLISNLDIPIDIIPGASLSTYSSEELQKISVKAVRLDRNWLRTPPRVYHTLDLDIRDDHFTSGIQGVSWVSSSISAGGRWLLVTSLSAILMGLHLEMRMSLWYLGDIDNPLCVLNIARTSGAVNGQHIVPRETGRRSATFCFSSAAVGSLHQVVEIHSVSLADAGRDFTTTDSKFVVKPHPRAPSARLSIIEISASDNDEILISTAYTGAGVVPDDQGINPGRRQIFFVNKRSGRVHWVDSRWVECCMRIWSRLYDGFLILIAEVDGVVVLRIYEIPSGIFSQSKGSGDEDHNPSDMVELGPVVAEYQFHPNFSKGQCIRGVSQVAATPLLTEYVTKAHQHFCRRSGHESLHFCGRTFGSEHADGGERAPGRLCRVGFVLQENSADESRICTGENSDGDQGGNADT